MPGEGVTRKELDEGMSPSFGIIVALQEHLDRNVVEFQPPLQSVIDADALNRITESPDAEIEFRFQNCHVRVKNRSVVEVTSA